MKRRRSWSTISLTLIAFITSPGLLIAQGMPLGPEFRVNTSTAGSQVLGLGRSMAADAAGNFVVVWSTNLPGGSADVFAQRYTSIGASLGGEFRVNTYTTFTQFNASVACDSDGNFVITWASFYQDGSQDGIFAQRFDTTGNPLGGEFRVNTFTLGRQAYSTLASDPAGNFVVVWASYGQDGSYWGVFGQRYGSTGMPLGAEFRANTYTTSDQTVPSVASDSAGNFIVAWYGVPPCCLAEGVYGQRYASTGAPLGNEFKINTFSIGAGHFPSVAANSSGDFVVTWHTNSQDGSGRGVFAQRYASTGVPRGGEFRVNTYTTSHQLFASVASDSAGNFVIAWESYAQDGDRYGVFAQRYASTGEPLGGDFRVNSFTTSHQREPSVASDPLGNFVIAWSSLDQDGSLYGVFGQRYRPILPVELQSFRVE